MTDVLFHVQHLFGIGHLRRAAALTAALQAAGLRVLLASGGRPVPGLDLAGADFVQLPPAYSPDESFRELRDETGAPIDAAWRDARRDRLLALFDAAAPRVLITEMFPFGRRQFRFELLPLLQRADARRPRPRIVCSVRDVLVDKPAGRTLWMAETAERFYDAVLVHGDPQLVAFDETFAHMPRIAHLVRYTGYLANVATTTAEGSRDSGEVLVSIGGGAFGRHVVVAALEAKRHSRLAEAPWRVLVGPNLPDAEFVALRALGQARGARVERARPDFPALLRHCRLSISQAGYNTVMEILASGAPAVVVPYAAGGETEQARRARRLAARALLHLVEESTLTPQALAEAIDAAAAAGPRPPVALDGAAESAKIIADMAAIVPDAAERKPDEV